MYAYWPIHELDIKNAFLHGNRSEAVHHEHVLELLIPSFSEVPIRIETSSMYLVHLLRNLSLEHIGLHASCANTSLFVLNSQNQTAYLLLYVEDMIITTSTTILLHMIISCLYHEFNMMAGTGARTLGAPPQGFVCFFGDNLISSSFMWQISVSRSSVEIEYRDFANAMYSVNYIISLCSTL
ncbi:hypothetical protein U9M48_031296 [Paspalum notatum var. saurae]|uniref:Reverse transcriptase Ty1/copia-type domain-containing protein n=1 Tax=Paspalum notatum var. saurae TaxID=547442 RepID=A0AAQ3U3Q2_PASNO